jgi:tetratricopeptide (TPR) repeat protein
MDANNFFADGLKQLQAGALRDALDALSIAIQLDPEFGEAYAYRGTTHYQLGDYDAAMQDYDTAVTLSPNLAEAYFFRATLYGQRRDHENAIDDYGRAIELNPTRKHGRPYLHLDMQILTVRDVRFPANNTKNPAEPIST